MESRKEGIIKLIGITILFILIQIIIRPVREREIRKELSKIKPVQTIR